MNAKTIVAILTAAVTLISAIADALDNNKD